jgi:hypothetical protein
VFVSKLKQTVFVVFEVEEPKDTLIGSRLTLEAAILVENGGDERSRTIEV